MRITAILSLCAATLLAGCGSLGTQLTETSKGKTYEQLVASQSTVKKLELTNIWIIPSDMVSDPFVYCYKCDGQPDRTYTSNAGNEVVVYFYFKNVNKPIVCQKNGVCGGGYSYCQKFEQHFEIVNGAVNQARVIYSNHEVNRSPMYSNACNGVNPYIEKQERNTIWGDKGFDQD